jgi:hypothetical protein
LAQQFIVMAAIGCMDAQPPLLGRNARGSKNCHHLPGNRRRRRAATTTPLVMRIHAHRSDPVGSEISLEIGKAIDAQQLLSCSRWRPDLLVLQDPGHIMRYEDGVQTSFERWIDV